MKQNTIEPNDKLLVYFSKSIGIHGTIIILLYAANLISPMVINKGLKLNPEIKFLKSAVRVDLVAMPTETLKELKKIELTSPPDVIQEKKVETTKVEVEKETEVPGALELKKYDKNEKKKNLLSILKNISKADHTTKKPSSTIFSKLKGLSGKDVSGVVLLGNKISEGNSVTGTTGEADSGAFASYASNIPLKVKPFWKLPSYLMGKNLQCRVRIFIAANGELLNAEIYESSGVTEYDEKAIEAVRAASPFSVPDPSLKKRLLGGEIALGFPL